MIRRLLITTILATALAATIPLTSASHEPGVPEPPVPPQPSAPCLSIGWCADQGVDTLPEAIKKWVRDQLTCTCPPL